MAEFLFEIGLEEVPARMIASAEAELARRVTALLERERLISAGAAVRSFSTPRRLAVLVSDVAAKQEDLAEEMQGPSAKIAYKDGVATPAAVAFAKKAGVAVEALKMVTTPKGEYLAATSVKAGRWAVEVIAAELPKELAAIYWAKNMYWRAGKPERFVRPVRWMVALLDSEIVPVEFAGYTAANVTYGHRVLAGPAAIAIASPSDYVGALEAAFVIADVEARRHRIRKALDRVCRTLPETRWREDHELVHKLTHLTEWPSVLAGGFEAAYLELPEEVLVTVMRDHQNYFAVEDKAGKLAPHFLAVLNTVATVEGEAVIRHGNERVLRARFNDAGFFWEFDQRVPLVDRVALLENVTFQKDLGSYAAKSERVRRLVATLATAVAQAKGGFLVDTEALDIAAQLFKTDLTAELVKEFTELQGKIGGLYAKKQGLSKTVSEAIRDQYTPASATDRVSSSYESNILGLADRIDTIAGMFSLGMEPTGSKDPFALRRAANAIVSILAESGLPLSLSGVIDSTNPSAEVAERIQGFFHERVEFYLRERHNFSYDVVKAVMAAGTEDLQDTIDRAKAVMIARSSADFAAVSAAFKRMKNILAQAKEKGFATDATFQDALLIDLAERALAEQAAAVAARVESLRSERQYEAALEEIASLRPQVDAFFDAVMVMAPEAEVRANRLALLARITSDFSRIADFSEIVVAG